MGRICYITEEQYKRLVGENVYVSKVGKNDATLTYNKGRAVRGQNQNKTDMLGTDKMDNYNSDDTYEVPLKGGLVSYNITSINGTEVMHYFKRKFSKEKTTMNLNGNEYELKMADSEYAEFMKTFIAKVETVIKSYIKRNEGKEIPLDSICIYPVPSSSNFNIEMAKTLSYCGFNGLPVTVINQDILLKDLRNLQKDDDFIAKNKNFYNSRYSMSDMQLQGTVNQNLDNELEKQKVGQKVLPWINYANRYLRLLLTAYYQYNNAYKQGKDVSAIIQTMVENFRRFFDMLELIDSSLYYQNAVKGTESRIQADKIFNPKKYTKGPSVDKRSQAIWNIVSPYLRGLKNRATGTPYKEVEIQELEPVQFQIKNLGNSLRMGMKNIYNPNTNTELVKQEMEKIKGRLLIIFDDNISGGATLSDICYQLQQLGAEYIVPITFGKMREKNSFGIVPLNTPTNDKGEKGYNY